MQYFQAFAVNHQTGVVLPGAAVAVYLSGTETHAALFDEDGDPIANPLTATSLALFGFAAADGTYDVQISSGSYSAPRMSGLMLFDGVAVQAQIAAVEAQIDGALAGFLRYQTKALMEANTTADDGQLAEVFNNNDDPSDPENGIYQWMDADTEWVRATWYADMVASSARTNELYAAAYGVEYAYATAADFSASPPVSPPDGSRMIWYNDPEPTNNIWFDRVAGAWVDGGPYQNVAFIQRRVPSLAFSPNAYEYNVTWDTGFNNDGIFGGVRLNVDANGVTNFNPGNSFYSAYVDGVKRFDVNNSNGLTYMLIGSNNSAHFLGMGHNGDGVMSLFSKLHPTTGEFAPMVFMGWSGTVGDVVEMNFTGTNRVHLHSAGAFVSSTQNGRNEREGYGAVRLNYVGYEIASSTGKTFDFNNGGQSSYPGQVVSISSVVAGQKLLQFCSLSGSTYTERGYISDTALAFFTAATIRAATPAIRVEADSLGTGSLKFFGNALTTNNEMGTIDLNANTGQMRIGTTRISYWTDIISNSLVVETFENNGNKGFGLKSYGGGVKVISEVNATTAPTSNPTGGIVRYAESGSGKVRTPGGNIVTYAPNTAISVTGSRASGAALVSLIAALVSLGLIADNTTA